MSSETQDEIELVVEDTVLVDVLCAAIDAFNAGMQAFPDGNDNPLIAYMRMSALAAIAAHQTKHLYESIRTDEGGAFVLVAALSRIIPGICVHCCRGESTVVH